ncbi:hypothetical protein BAX94_12465 [Elizabethkingia meningoseptica]|uniref:Uncharacterized protein n=1 Tax=Elizabethkingia meningoseptica TaxID=238 RepID=A0A1V3TVI0_ELIME|nr:MULTISPECIES: hypothetical protein [Elizabethkingia]AQX04602.1 hypothetical protein BBD33_04765 [Elizabethkingia meningoseptica]AQX12064.1 hypothetical protein BBD35_06595 [Elizabethkingia meningoseptica]MCL1676760.1 hypothetical protein [Elizabethkingia meningoseptica]MCL1686635.1 hypothetical protein [Elizabethkingia meningoseptica]MDX8575165.1 hypothetical protein [Elizabethkingia sp. HX WYD]
MKYLSIIILGIFLNFMALPSIAKLMDWDLPTMSQNLSEEEVKIKRMSEEQLHSEPLQIQKIHWDESLNKAFVSYNDNELIDPLLIIFSPPPEA